MTEKKPTISSLKREIERLKARAAVLEMEVERRDVIIREHIYGVVDAKMKIKQAMAILSGEDQ